MSTDPTAKLKKLFDEGVSFHGSVMESHNATITRISITTGAGRRTKGIGDARRHPSDKYDADIGRLLATGRAFQSLGRKLERRAWGLVKHADDMKAMSGEQGDHSPPLTPDDFLDRALEEVRAGRLQPAMTVRKYSDSDVAHALWMGRALCGVQKPTNKLTGRVGFCMNCRGTKKFEWWIKETTQEFRDKTWEDAFE